MTPLCAGTTLLAVTQMPFVLHLSVDAANSIGMQASSARGLLFCLFRTLLCGLFFIRSWRLLATSEMMQGE